MPAADLLPACTEMAAGFGVAPPIHEKDFLARYLLDRYPTPGDAVRAYFMDGDLSAQKLAYFLHQRLGFESGGRPGRYRLFEFASGYGMVTRHLANYLPDLSRQASKLI